VTRRKFILEAAIAFAVVMTGLVSQQREAPQATAQQPPNEMRKAIPWKRFEYSCDGDAKVTVYLREAMAKIRYQDKQYLMKQTLSADGNRYSDGKVVWWGKGNGGFLQEDRPDGTGGMIVKNCKLVELPNGQLAGAGKVNGAVTYLQRVALSPAAVIEVKLQDVSRADAAAIVIAEQKFAADGKQVPLPFELKFDPAKIDAKHRYTVSARITLDGELRFVSDQAYAVVTQGNPSTGVDILLKPVPAK
jgi:uncharacterized lipoprotein YbaY